jgi:hypothetical protein
MVRGQLRTVLDCTGIQQKGLYLRKIQPHGCARGHPPLPSAPGRDEPNAHPPLAGPVLQLNRDD